MSFYFSADDEFIVDRDGAPVARREAPPRTPEMIENAQVWVWMHDNENGHWEVRGTGAKLK